ncbi:head maturation protease, ClpP-related [Lysinibacillus sp. LZ02]|uniref:head maturation protease, ClpP-related n=1 Tax=Lysinibacillus sp. LZ02 TaxID=3420668 RepID=UPI003D36DC6A
MSKVRFKARFKNEKYSNQIPKIQRQFEARVNGETNTTELIIYGVIGDGYEDGISAIEVDAALAQVQTENILVRINSPGGDAFEGITIYNRLKDHKAYVKVIVDGWACSAASIIAMAADQLIMNKGALFMVHEGITIIWGNKAALLAEYEVLKKLDASLVDIYMTKAQVSREEMETLLVNETWFTAEEAMTIGFATSADETPHPQPADPEAFKNSVLAKLRKSAPTNQQSNFMDKFKRGQQS